MKKLISIVFSAILIANVFALDVKYVGEHKTEFHNHKYYTLELDTETKNAAWIKWTLTNDEAIEADAVDNRTNDFRKCGYPFTMSATKQDYVNSGYDKGHGCPSNDMDFSKEAASATFYMCNMFPQTPNLNRGVWKKYEVYGHSLAKKYGQVEIICGPIYITNPKTIGNGVKVPDMFFKIFTVDDNSQVYVFTNTKDAQVRQVSLGDLQKIVNVKIEK